MRTYRDMDLPGIDMLCDNREYNTAKQAASVSRQMGRRGVMSEEYGVTGWDFTFEGHKVCLSSHPLGDRRRDVGGADGRVSRQGQGDWQAALGVTLRVHHLFWSTMRGEAKRDYPACIGYQSPWYREYPTIENHFARIHSALTRGRPLTRIGVIHPIESFWLCFGPKDKNAAEMIHRDRCFSELTEWLLLSHLDFDFISESLFPEMTDLESIGRRLVVGKCHYDVVIVPNLRTIRSTTLERLRLFSQRGGTVLIAGEAPTMMDGHVTSTPPEIPVSNVMSWSKDQVLKTLAPFRDLEMRISETTIYRTQGVLADSLIYQMREEGDERFVFICNTDRNEACPVNISLVGEYNVKVSGQTRGYQRY